MRVCQCEHNSSTSQRGVWGCQNVSVLLHIIVRHRKNNGTNYHKSPSFIKCSNDSFWIHSTVIGKTIYAPSFSVASLHMCCWWSLCLSTWQVLHLPFNLNKSPLDTEPTAPDSSSTGCKQADSGHTPWCIWAHPDKRSSKQPISYNKWASLQKKVLESRGVIRSKSIYLHCAQWPVISMGLCRNVCIWMPWNHYLSDMAAKLWGSPSPRSLAKPNSMKLITLTPGPHLWPLFLPLYLCHWLSPAYFFAIRK